MFKKIIHFLFKDLFILVAAYQNNVFPDPLEKEEEEKLIALMLKGDQNARNKLIEHNLRLVAHIVKKYEHTKDDADDLISIGVIGLIKGVDSYSYKHGTRITTYCARSIENEILMHFRNDKDGNEITLLEVLKTPTPDFVSDIHEQDNLKLLVKYYEVLNEREKEIIEKRYGLNGNDELTQKEIAEYMNISRSYVSRIEKRALTKLLREFIKNKRNS